MSSLDGKSRFVAEGHATVATLATVADWHVLRCASSRTIALAKALERYGAWTPTWKRRRRMPRSQISRLVTEACIPSFVFVPADQVPCLPQVALTPYSLMLFDGARVVIADRDLDPLRRIADKPKVKAADLPKPGALVSVNGLGFEGLRAKVLACTQTYATVAVEGFRQPIKVPPSLLLKK